VFEGPALVPEKWTKIAIPSLEGWQ